MKDIIKILEEHNIKCVQDGNDLSLSHKNFCISIKDVHAYKHETDGQIQFYNSIMTTTIYYYNEYMSVTIY